MAVRVATVARSMAVAVAKFAICYGVNGFLLVKLGCVFFLQEIGGVKFSASSGTLGFSLFVVCSGEEGFEDSPSFLLNRQTFPGFEVVYKNAGLVYKLEDDAKNLF